MIVTVADPDPRYMPSRRTSGPGAQREVLRHHPLRRSRATGALSRGALPERYVEEFLYGCQWLLRARGPDLPGDLADELMRRGPGPSRWLWTRCSGRTFDRVNRRGGTQREEIARQKKDDKYGRAGAQLAEPSRLTLVSRLQWELINLRSLVLLESCSFAPG